MEIKTGYLYHIKDEFFDKVKDSGLMTNHESGKTRPTYLTIKENKILWFIPISSKVEKYKKIINNKIKKYGKCNTIIIRKIFDKESAVLIQNAFPITEKYIDHAHLFQGKHAKVSPKLKEEIIELFKETLSMKEEGINLFFADIDKIMKAMILELEESKTESKIINKNYIYKLYLNNNNISIEVPSKISTNQFINYIYETSKINKNKDDRIYINNKNIKNTFISNLEEINKNETISIQRNKETIINIKYIKTETYPKVLNENMEMITN